MGNVEGASDTVPVTDIKYAGFWIRFFAFIIDMIILVIFTAVVGLFLMGLISMSAYLLLHLDILTNLTFSAILAIALFIVPWLYFSLSDSSRYMATPGKTLLRLKVKDLAGNRISFYQATVRYFIKYGVAQVSIFLNSILLLASGILIFVFDIDALENIRYYNLQTINMISEAMLLVGYAIVLISACFILYNHNKQALHDMIAGTIVVKSK